MKKCHNYLGIISYVRITVDFCFGWRTKDRVDNGRICQEMPVSEAQDSGGNL